MKKKKNRNYFTSETEDAIIEYNNTDCVAIRNRLYHDKIHYPFFKLTQNIIHTFKFYHTDVSDLAHLQHEIEVFLLEKMHLYHHSNNLWKRIKNITNKSISLLVDENIKCHPSFFEFTFPLSFYDFVNGSPKVTQDQINDYINLLPFSVDFKKNYKKLTPPKAYSYFGTIVKRWCIVYNDKNYQNKIKNSPIDILSKDESYTYDILDNNPQELISNFLDVYVKYMEDNLKLFFNKPLEIEIANSILEVFKKRESLEVFHKKAIYTYLYEMVPGIKTNKITKVSNRLKDIFFENYNFYLNNGYVDFDSENSFIPNNIYE